MLQDIAVVPFLVLLPLVEGDNVIGQPGQSTMTLVASLGPTALQTLLGLGALLLGGRVVLRRIFELVCSLARSRSQSPEDLASGQEGPRIYCPGSHCGSLTTSAPDAVPWL